MTQDALAFPRGRAAWHAGFRALPYVERIRTTPRDVADWAAERYSTRRDLALLPAGGRASGHRCPGRTPGTLPACREPLYDNVVSRHKVARLRHQGGFVLRPFASPARELPEIVDFFPVS